MLLLNEGAVQNHSCHRQLWFAVALRPCTCAGTKFAKSTAADGSCTLELAPSLSLQFCKSTAAKGSCSFCSWLRTPHRCKGLKPTAKATAAIGSCAFAELLLRYEGAVLQKHSCRWQLWLLQLHFVPHCEARSATAKSTAADGSCAFA